MLKLSIWAEDAEITNVPKWLEWFDKRGMDGLAKNTKAAEHNNIALPVRR